MKIKIPAECQNGHKADWCFEIKGLEVIFWGVPNHQKCDCSKFDFGDGYEATGKPEVFEE